MSAPVSVTKKTKMADLINFRLQISTLDGRSFTGQLLAFDKHMNLVLADTEEARTTKKSYQELAKAKVGSQVKVTEDKRFLGLIILRGEQVVSVVIKSGPTADIKKRMTQLKQSRPVKTPVSQKEKLKGPSKARS